MKTLVPLDRQTVPLLRRISLDTWAVLLALLLAVLVRLNLLTHVSW